MDPSKDNSLEKTRDSIAKSAGHTPVVTIDLPPTGRISVEMEPENAAEHKRELSRMNWRPFAMRRYYQSLLILISVLFLLATETLRQISNRNKGFVFFERPEEITKLTSIAYNYLPTTIGVIYSIMWSLFDADMKRLEPYFQMASKSSPANNLLLDYTFQSSFLVPLRAFRNKHWMLVATSGVYLFVSLVLPAAFGAVLFLENVLVEKSRATFETTGLVHEPHDMFQGDVIPQLQVVLASGGQKLPSWTTLEYVVEPFTTMNSEATQNETWSAQTTVAFAEPHCSKFEASNWNITSKCCILSPNKGQIGAILYLAADLALSDEQGPTCELSFSRSMIIGVTGMPIQNYSIWVPEDTSLKQMQLTSSFNISDIGQIHEPYILPSKLYETRGVYSSSYSSSYQKSFGATCPTKPRVAGYLTVERNEQINELLASLDIPTSQEISNLSSNTQSEIINIIETAMNEMITAKIDLFACRTKYYSAQANVTVRGKDGVIIDVVPASTRRALSSIEFNNTDFETILDQGATSSIMRQLDVHTVGFDESFISDVVRPSNVSHLSLSQPGIWSVEFGRNLETLAFTYSQSAFGSTPKILNQTIFEFGRTMETIYRLAFAVAFRSLIASTASTRHLEGSRNQDLISIAVNSPFAILAEVILTSAIFVLFSAFFLLPRRKCVLQSDPDSISAQCALIKDIIHNSGPLQSVDYRLDEESTKSLKRILKPMSISFEPKSQSLNVVSQEPHDNDSQSSGVLNSNRKLRGDSTPLFLLRRGMILIISSGTTLAAGLLFLVIWTSKIRGFPSRHNFTKFESQLLLSFLPALMATFIESYWLSIHTKLTLLESWARMKQGKALIEDALSIRYSSRPPLIVLFLSLKQRHFLIALLSFLSITMSIFNVSMAGLFSQAFLNIPNIRQTTTAYTSISLKTDFSANGLANKDAWHLTYSNITESLDLMSWTTNDFAFIPVLAAEEGNSIETEPMFTNYRSTTLGIGASLTCQTFPTDYNLLRSGLGVWFQKNGDAPSVYKIQARFLPTTPINGSDTACEAYVVVQNDLPATYFSLMREVGLNESGIFDPQADSERPPSFTQQAHSRCNSDLVFVNVDSQSHDINLFLCRPGLEVHGFEVQHDTNGNIAKAQKLERQSPLSPEEIGNLDDFQNHFLSEWLVEAAQWSRKTSMGAYDWPGLLITHFRHAHNFSMIEAADRMYSQTFATWFSWHMESLLEPPSTGQPTLVNPTGVVYYRQLRIIPSIPAFGLSICLLITYLISYFIIISQRRRQYTGPRMPKSVGSLIPWVAHSRMLEDFRGLHAMTTKDRDAALRKLRKKYGFGKFRDRDGKVRLGIEHEELLIAEGPQTVGRRK